MCSPRLRINITEAVLDVSQLFHLTVLCTFVPPNNLFWTLNVFDAMNVFSMTSMTRCVCFRRYESPRYDFYDAVWMFSTLWKSSLWLLWCGVSFWRYESPLYDLYDAVCTLDAVTVFSMTCMMRCVCFRRYESLLYDFYDAVCMFSTLWKSSLWLVWRGVCFGRCESLL